jgi:hypothetical protein
MDWEKMANIARARGITWKRYAEQLREDKYMLAQAVHDTRKERKRAVWEMEAALAELQASREHIADLQRQIDRLWFHVRPVRKLEDHEIRETEEGPNGTPPIKRKKPE